MKTLNLLILATALALPATACDSGNKEDAKQAKGKGKKDAPKKDAPKKDEPKPDAKDGGDAPKAGGGDAPKPEPAPEPDPADEKKVDPKVDQAVKIAGEIEAAPGDADAILEKNGLDREGLDALMYEIARDPLLTAEYKAARAS